MLWIEYGPFESHLKGDDRKELKEAYAVLHKEMSVWIDGAIFTPRFQSGMWDGHVHFFNNTSGRFRSGLLSAVVRHLLEHDLYVEIRGYPEAVESYESLTRIELHDNKLGIIAMDAEDPVRDYQLHAAKQVLKWHRGILKLATNGGKTEVAAGIIKVLHNPVTIFIVPSRELLHQTKERLEERLQTQVGIVGDGHFKPNLKGITVAMYQTLHKKFDAATKRWYKSVKLLFCDECHYVMADTYQKCVRRIPADFRVGLSATPFERDLVKRLTVTGFLGPVLSAVNNAKLMDKGVSARPSVLLLEPQVSQEELLNLRMADYDEAITQCHTRNQLIAALAQGFVKSGRQTLVMCNRIAHVKALKALIPNAVTATGRNSNTWRDKVKAALAEGKGLCCITTLFDTGLSVDYIEGMIMASGGMDSVKLLQKIGRTVRNAKDVQKDVWIVDFFDHYNKYTRKHSRERRKIYEGQKAFHITEHISEAPVELLEFVTPSLVHHKHLQRPLAL